MEKEYCENLKAAIYPKGLEVKGHALRVTEFMYASVEAQKAFDTIWKIYNHILSDEKNCTSTVGKDVLNIISDEFLG